MAHPDYRAIIRRGWAIVIGALVISGLAAFLIAATTTPLFTSSTTLLFSVRDGSSPTDLNQGAQYTAAQMGSLAELATSPIVLNSVNRDLALNEGRNKLASQITATVPTGTVVLNISVETTNAQLSQQIANAVSDAVSQQSEAYSPTDLKGNTLLRAVQIETAQIPTSPSSPSYSRNLTEGLIIGLIVGVLIVIIREALDRRVRTPADIAAITDAPILAVVGRDATAHTGAVLEMNPASEVAETYRRLRMNLDALDPRKQGTTIVVTSALPGEGKSTVSVNLALAYVEAGERVVIVDANLRHPGLTSYAGGHGVLGLSDVLDGVATVGSVLRDYDKSGLQVLSAGSTHKNPGGLLSSPNLKKVISAIKKDHDVVIFDAADVTSAADAAELSKSLDGVLLVTDVDHLRAPQLTSAVDALNAAGVPVLGVVGNRSEAFHGRAPARTRAAKPGPMRSPQTPAPKAKGKEPVAAAEPSNSSAASTEN
jgi:succinoglycan biosynthesis transport protein ExoP